jgi:ABC-type Na+ efflux pump permease subunit
MIWLIARRAAAESLRDRMTRLLSASFVVIIPILLVVFALRPLTGAVAADGRGVGGLLAIYLLVVGLLPATSSAGIAAGLFAGEQERGVLTPLLASPASNLAIFAGKVLGAVLPPLLYAALAEIVYFGGVAQVFGVGLMTVVPWNLAVAMVLLVPAVTCFAAATASIISSRVRTYNSAQQLTGLALAPVYAIIFFVAANLPTWGTIALAGLVLGLLVLDAALVVVGAATWRREEVLSRT